MKCGSLIWPILYRFEACFQAFVWLVHRISAQICTNVSMQGRQTAQNHLIQKTFMMINTSDYHDGGGKKEHEDGCEHNLKGSHGSGIHFVDEGELIDK